MLRRYRCWERSEEAVMVMDALRGYVQLASGLTEVTKQKAQAAAKALLQQTGADKVTSKVSDLADEIIATSKSNRQLLQAIVSNEVEGAVSRLGFVRSEEVASLSRRVKKLETELADARAETATASPATGAAAGSAAGSTAAAADLASGPAGDPLVDDMSSPAPLTDAAAENPAAEEAAAKKLAKKAAAKKAVTGEPVTNGPVADEAVTAEPLADEAVGDNPVVSDAAAAKAAADKAADNAAKAADTTADNAAKKLGEEG